MSGYHPAYTLREGLIWLLTPALITGYALYLAYEGLSKGANYIKNVVTSESNQASQLSVTTHSIFKGPNSANNKEPETSPSTSPVLTLRSKGG